MSFSRPTLNDLKSQAQSDFLSRISGSSAPLRRAFLKVLATVLAGIAHALYGFLQEEAKQSCPATATDIRLRQWASLWKVYPKQATKANGTVSVTGDPGAQVLAGVSLQSPDGSEFIVDNLVTLDGAGNGTINVTAAVVGASGNQIAGTKLTFISPQDKIDSTAIVLVYGLQDGADEEDDDSLFSRLQDRVANPPHSGNAEDYKIWAESNGNVDRAWVFPTYDGPGTVRVYIADDEYDGPTLASASTVTEVAAYIEQVRPVGACIDDGDGGTVTGITVLAPTVAAQDFQLTIGPDTPANRAAVQANLVDLFKRETTPEGTLPLSRIRDAISQAGTIYDFNLTTPSANVTAAAGHISKVGNFTWA